MVLYGIFYRVWKNVHLLRRKKLPPPQGGKWGWFGLVLAAWGTATYKMRHTTHPGDCASVQGADGRPCTGSYGHCAPWSMSLRVASAGFAPLPSPQKCVRMAENFGAGQEGVMDDISGVWVGA